MSIPVAWNHLRRFSALTGREQRLFLRAAFLLPLLSVILRRSGLRRTQERLRLWLPVETGGIRPVQGAAETTIAMTVRMVRAAVKHGPARATCLEESLALWWLLGRQGIPALLRIGIRKQTGKFEAHAWVECAGATLNDPEGLHFHYTAFDKSFPLDSTEAP